MSWSRAGFAIVPVLALPALPDSPCVASVSLPNTATARSFTMAEHDVPPRPQLVRTAELIPSPCVCQEKKLGTLYLKAYNFDYILCKSVRLVRFFNKKVIYFGLVCQLFYSQGGDHTKCVFYYKSKMKHEEVSMPSTTSAQHFT